MFKLDSKNDLQVIKITELASGKIETFVGDDLAEGFEGTVFGEDWNVTGFYKVIDSFKSRPGFKVEQYKRMVQV